VSRPHHTTDDTAGQRQVIASRQRKEKSSSSNVLLQLLRTSARVSRALHTQACFRRTLKPVVSGLEGVTTPVQDLDMYDSVRRDGSHSRSLTPRWSRLAFHESSWRWIGQMRTRKTDSLQYGILDAGYQSMTGRMSFLSETSNCSRHFRRQFPRVNLQQARPG